MPEVAVLHPVSRRHLDELTGPAGIMQHAVGTRPDPSHGYCTDDVARALQVDLLHQAELGWRSVATSASRSILFLEEAFDARTGRFRNFRSGDGTWLDAPGSEDCHGRAMLALAETAAYALDSRVVAAARVLFARGLPATRGLTALRAQGSVIVGCVELLRAAPDDDVATAIRLLAARLFARFGSRSGSSWPWPEPTVTYENGLLARALIVAGDELGSTEMTATGLRALDWLIAAQTTTAGWLSPIGNGWWAKDGERSQFDQQPIEATALLLAAKAALDVTGDARYTTVMEQSFAWFLGANDLGVMIADPEHGGGCDGLTRDGVNTNQGAESTLMWLMASEHIRRMRRSAAGRVIETSPPAELALTPQ